jgi:hypothetical protein
LKAVEGWEDWFHKDYVLKLPYPDFDVEGIHAYAKQGKMIMHQDLIPNHVSSDEASVYERYMML